MQGDLDNVDRFAVASRIRSLIGDPDGEYTDVVADRLHVDEAALRVSVDPEQPHPAANVIVAIVREYGVDPSWLLTGIYDGATHRHVLQHPEGTTAEALERLVRDHQSPAGVLNVGVVRGDAPPEE